nr:hypothetical protein Iba_chr14dCG17750 [Ipomoea batatas]
MTDVSNVDDFCVAGLVDRHQSKYHLCPGASSTCMSLFIGWKIFYYQNFKLHIGSLTRLYARDNLRVTQGSNWLLMTELTRCYDSIFPWFHSVTIQLGSGAVSSIPVTGPLMDWRLQPGIHHVTLGTVAFVSNPHTPHLVSIQSSLSGSRLGRPAVAILLLLECNWSSVMALDFAARFPSRLSLLSGMEACKPPQRAVSFCSCNTRCLVTHAGFLNPGYRLLVAVAPVDLADGFIYQEVGVPSDPPARRGTGMLGSLFHPRSAGCDWSAAHFHQSLGCPESLLTPAVDSDQFPCSLRPRPHHPLLLTPCSSQQERDFARPNRPGAVVTPSQPSPPKHQQTFDDSLIGWRHDSTPEAGRKRLVVLDTAFTRDTAHDPTTLPLSS